jgi:hypothetical protein
MVLGVVRDGDSLVARERPDQDVGALLFDQAASLLDGLVRGGVRAPVADDLDVLAADLGVLDALGRLLARGLSAGVGDHRLVHARCGRLEEGAEVALAVGQEADLDRVAAASPSA